MGFSIKYIYQAVDKFTPVVDKVQMAALGLKYKMEAIGKSVDKIGEKLEKVGKKFERAGREWSEHISLPLGAIGLLAMEGAAKMEEMEAQFSTMLKSGAKARQLTLQLMQFSETAPFKMDDIGPAATKLLAFGVAQDQITNKLKFLGDIAAGSHKSLLDLATIYGRVQSRGKAAGRDIIAVNAMGIPIVAALTKTLHLHVKSQQEAAIMIGKLAQKGKISAQVYERALRSLTTAGGIFQGQMNKMDDTLPGQIERLHKVIADNFARIGEDANKLFNFQRRISQLSDFLGGMADRFEKLTPTTQRFILILGFLLFVIGPLLLIVGVFIRSLGMLLMVVKPLLAVLGFLAEVISLLSWPVILIISVIGILAGAFYYCYKHFKTFHDGLKSGVRAIIGWGKDLGATAMWIIHGFMGLARAVLGLIPSFKSFGDFASSILTHIIDWANDLKAVIMWIIGGFKNLGGITLNPIKLGVEIGKKWAEHNADTNAQQQAAQSNSATAAPTSKAKIDVHIIDKGNNVAAVKSKTSGSSIDLNTGVNLWGAV